MKAVGIADLKAHLSEHIREVRRGASLIVMDRKHPVARLVPYERAAGGLQIRKPRPGSPPPGQVPLPEPAPPDFDIVDLLLEDRERRR